MATRAENLSAAIDNVALLIREITEHPKPSYSVDGKSVSWTEYLSMLTSQLLALEQAAQRAESPWEIRLRGIA